MEPTNPYRQNSKEARKSAWFIAICGVVFTLAGLSIFIQRPDNWVVGGSVMCVIGLGLLRYGLKNTRSSR